MNVRQQFSHESPEIQTYFREDIAVIKIKSHVFDTITDLADSGRLLSMMQAAERIPDIKALMIINESGCMDDQEYDNFLKRILSRGSDPFSDEKDNIQVHRIDRVREINILNRTISYLVEFKKIAVMAFQGVIVTPFFGAGLAADFRYAAEGMEFSLAHLRYGLHPSGALPFFLPRFVGHSKAVEILFGSERISAAQALELGLINRIFPKKDFESHCIEEIEKICHLDTRVIHSTKFLVNISRTELRNYFDLETALLH